MSSRDDIAAAMERVDRARQANAAKPGLQRPSMEPREKPPMGGVRKVPNSVAPRQHAAEFAPPRRLDPAHYREAQEILRRVPEHHRAKIAAEFLHGQGLHPDHPEAAEYVAGTGIDSDHLRRVHEAVARGFAAKQAGLKPAQGGAKPPAYLKGSGK